MCKEPATAGDVRAAMPHPVVGSAADPIALEPVDDVVVTTLVDNLYDALLTSDDSITRAPFAAGTAQAPQFEPGRTNVGLMAEHGFSALVTVRRGDTTTSVLFDTGLSPDAMVTNAGRLGLDLSGVHAVVLSHGHFDHAGGLAGLAGRRGTRSLPMVVHPLVWTRRRLALPGGGADDWPTLSKRALTGEGFDVIERRQPSLLVDGSILITGEVDRTTDFEHGMPPAHQHWTGGAWEPDPLILDDQALVVNVRGKGLVIVTGCGHAGAVNIVRHAQRLTGVPRLHALLGGLHLGGAFFAPSIGPTVHALTELAPDLLVPGHCTGWRAQHTLAAALPDSWIQGSSGTRYQLTSSLPARSCYTAPSAIGARRIRTRKQDQEGVALAKVREGIDEPIHPSGTSSFDVAYIVLAISTVLDLVSFRRSAGQMVRRARRYHREFLEESWVTSGPARESPSVVWLPARDLLSASAPGAGRSRPARPVPRWRTRCRPGPCPEAGIAQ